MAMFAYSRPSTIESVLSLLASDPGAAIIAGGTELLPLLRDGQAEAARVVDINALPLNEIAETIEGLRLGALARLQDVADHVIVRERYRVVSTALLAGASLQIRNAASIGGNLLQRTRCPYFRDTAFPCNKRTPGSGCPAIDGDHRPHAILGGSDSCIATHASDLAIALCALDAEVEIAGPLGRRLVPLREFYRLPADTPHRETILEHDEIVVAVVVPRRPEPEAGYYLKVRDRASFEFALVSVAAVLGVEHGRVRSVRIAAGGVATVPWRLPLVEQAIVGQPPTRQTFGAAAAKATDGARLLEHNAFKASLLQRAVVRALEMAAGTGDA